MVSDDDVARAVVGEMVRARTASAGALKDRLYATLAALGIDVGRLEGDAQARQLSEQRSKREQSWQRKLEKALAIRQLREPDFEPIFPTAPTRERVARAGEDPITRDVVAAAGPVTALQSHQFPWPVNKITRVLTAEEYAAAVRFREAYENRAARPNVGDYGTSSGRSDPARRLPVTPVQERAGREWNALKLHMPPAVFAIARELILEEPLPGHARPRSLVEFGKAYGNTTDARRAIGIAEGALKTVCGALAAIAREYDAWRRAQARELRAGTARVQGR